MLQFWSTNADFSVDRRFIGISDVVMTKYTSFFLTSDGNVFACGSGRGGRLGLQSEQTVLNPTKLLTLSTKKVVSLDASVYHAAFVTADGQLFVTGSSEQHQLGLGSNPNVKELSPKAVKLKKDSKLKHVVCGRFHTAVMSDRELFTCGLNAGQLGLSKDTTFQMEFKHVSSIAAAARDSSSGAFLDIISTSDSALAIKTIVGDVFVLVNYNCKKIASSCPGISHISVMGGTLDYTVAPDILRAEKGSDLIVLMLVGESGQILVWRENAQSSQGGILRELRYPGLGDSLVASSIWSPAPTGDGRFLVCSRDGNAYIVTLPSQSNAVAKSKPSKSDWAGAFFAHSRNGIRVNSYEMAKSTTRIKHIHRASKIVSDPAMLNFACIQTRAEVMSVELPISTTVDVWVDLKKLLSPYSESCDVELIFGSKQTLLAHRVILAGRSSFFRKAFTAKDEFNQFTNRVKFELMDCEDSEFKPLLHYAYTGELDLSSYLIPDDIEGKTVVSPSKLSPKKVTKPKKSSPKSGGNGGVKLSETRLVNISMLERLIDLAKRFGFPGLPREIDKVKGCAQSGKNYSKTFKPQVKLDIDRSKLEDLADVWLRSEDGREFAAHRCILSCRSDYFSSMLAVGHWAEAGRAVIEQHVEGDVLELALNYIYSDWLGDVTDWKLLCKLIIYADQVFLMGLKSVAELQLSMSPRMNLNNCCQLLDFAAAYRAETVLASATRFGIANLPCLLETYFTAISSLEDETLQYLGEEYRKLVCKQQRRVKPWDSMAPSEKDIKAIVTEAKECKLLMEDYDLETLIQKISDMDGSFKPPSEPTSNIIHRFVKNKRHRGRSERMSESSESSSSSGALTISIDKTSVPPSPLHSPAFPRNTPMSPSTFINRLNNMSVSSSKLSNTGGWSNHSQHEPNGSEVSLADIMANEKKQQENQQSSNDRGIKIKSNPRTWNLSSSASSPPSTLTLQILGTSPSAIGKPSPASPSTFKGWGNMASSPLASNPMPVLADILKQEKQKTENTRRQDRRSLHQIQVNLYGLFFYLFSN